MEHSLDSLEDLLAKSSLMDMKKLELEDTPGTGPWGSEAGLPSGDQVGSWNLASTRGSAGKGGLLPGSLR